LNPNGDRKIMQLSVAPFFTTIIFGGPAAAPNEDDSTHTATIASEQPDSQQRRRWQSLTDLQATAARRQSSPVREFTAGSIQPLDGHDQILHRIASITEQYTRHRREQQRIFHSGVAGTVTTFDHNHTFGLIYVQNRHTVQW